MKNKADHPRVAIVYDWLVARGGAERHVLEICRTYPGAPLFTSVYLSGETLGDFENFDVRQSWISKVPFFNRRHRLAFLLRYIHWMIIAPLQLRGYDIVLSASGYEAKGLRPRKGQLVINTIFSPTHYLWSHFDEYVRRPGLGALDPVARILLPILAWPLRKLDLLAAKQPHHYLANSNAVAARVQKYYSRNADVLFPPVSDLDLKPKDIQGPRSGLVAVGRQLPYKRIDLAITAANLLKMPLKVIGDGPEHATLKQLAGSTVEMLGAVSEPEKIAALTGSEALIFPNEDDFGITPVEGMMAGCPAVAYKAGGALDTVASPDAGVYFDQQTPEAVAEAVKQLLNNPPDPQSTRTWAMRFHEDVFRERLASYVTQKWQGFSR